MTVGVRALAARSMLAFFWVAVVSMVPAMSAAAASAPDWSGHWMVVATCTTNGCTGSSKGNLDLVQTGVTITGSGTNTDDAQPGPPFPVTGTADGSSATISGHADPISVTFYLTMSADGTTLTGTETATDSSKGVTTTVGTLTGSRILVAYRPSSTSPTVAPRQGTIAPVRVPAPSRGSGLPGWITIVVVAAGGVGGVVGAAVGSRAGKRRTSSGPASEPVGKLGEWKSKDPSLPPRVWIKHADDPKWYPSRPGADLRIGDEIRANDNTILTGEFVTGGRFGIRGATEVTVTGDRSIGGPAVDASERTRAWRRVREESGPVIILAGFAGVVVLADAASVLAVPNLVQLPATVGPTLAESMATGGQVLRVATLTAVGGGATQVLKVPEPPIRLTVQSIRG